MFLQPAELLQLKLHVLLAIAVITFWKGDRELQTAAFNPSSIMYFLTGLLLVTTRELLHFCGHSILRKSQDTELKEISFD